MSRRRSLFGAVAVAGLLVLGTGHAALSAAKTSPAVRSTTAVAAATAGCGKTPTLTNGTHTIQSGGKSRSFILRLPDGYDNRRPYRLVFGFHWWGGTATDVATGQTV
ncbi:hypothetical protein ABGB17_03950, partial [Sphaerisporangium sp. B11E5]